MKPWYIGPTALLLLAAGCHTASAAIDPTHSFARATLESVEFQLRDLSTGGVTPWEPPGIQHLPLVAGQPRLAPGATPVPGQRPHADIRFTSGDAHGSFVTEVSLPTTYLGSYSAFVQTTTWFYLPAFTEMSITADYLLEGRVFQHLEPYPDPWRKERAQASARLSISSPGCSAADGDAAGLSILDHGAGTRSGSLSVSCANHSEVDQFLWMSWSSGSQFETAAAVPEPETYALLLAGLAVLAWRASSPGHRASKAETAQ